MSKKDTTPNTVVDETTRPEEIEQTETTKKVGVTKTVKIRVPRTVKFELGDTVAYTVTEDGAKMRFGEVIDFTDEKIIIQTLSNRIIEREPIPALVIKIAGKPQDYADEIKTYQITL